MCTIVFAPLNDIEFDLLHNRDESIHRKIAMAPEWRQINDHSILSPIDSQKGGTWIWTSKEQTLFLFNGAFEKHERKENYHRSRGLILIEVLDYAHFSDFTSKVDLTNVEPFTIVRIPHEANKELTQLIWDGTNRHVSQLNRHIQIWSSVTLYSAEYIQRKKEKLASWKLNSNSRDLLSFMQDKKGLHPIFLNQPPMATVSTTIVKVRHTKTPCMDYICY